MHTIFPEKLGIAVERSRRLLLKIVCCFIFVAVLIEREQKVNYWLQTSSH